ncbi:magnesium transporter CorA family protein [Sphingomonas morindae]|uniref:Magnesium transporter CorA family protein n=1 Tax=Sphingomonas morindae TaxID=1541170 RepID=A0ABY4X464_9SPHN|nr:magnesium transporter CorA family protein [Sphingomonas morindae]USI71683.1 magnesium transporter CorA family protein [Sphingomonas morindae]
MLSLFPKTATLDAACWIDLREPSADEVARVSARLGMALPTRESLAEIEASSRLRADAAGLTMSAPLIGRLGEAVVLVPAGFVLREDVLVTIRFAEIRAFDSVHEALERDHLSGPQEVMIRLLEEIVDRAADRLERVAETLAEASGEIFSEPARGHRLGHETRRLRRLMVKIGRSNEELVRVRHSFLAIARMASFLLDRCEPRLAAGLRDRLKTVAHDVSSLDEFESSLVGRTSMLLDAAVGFISIEQNDVVKLLTVVSTAGVPPVLIAGIYGMNFKVMPELNWTMGYPFALALMVASTVLPVLWFKWRDWL